MNTRRTCTLIVALASLIALPALVAQETATDGISGLYRQEGIASWYGAEFEGRPTASGEAFVSAGLTAAHPSLPFGTLVQVTNRHNGKSVVVRVNDRGPFVAARIIDVSRGAAELLDMIVTGTAPVIVESDVAIPGVEAAPAPASPAKETPPDAKVTATIDSSGTIAVEGELVEEVKETATSIAETAREVDSWLNEKGDPGFDPAPKPASDPAVEATKEKADTGIPDSPLASSPTITSPEKMEEAPAAAERVIAVEKDAPALPPARVLPQLPEVKSGTFYRIQVGSYKVERFAALAFDKLEKASFVPAYERYLDMYRVVIPMVPSDKVEWYAGQLGKLGFREVLIRKER